MILRVDDKDVSGKDFDAAVALMRGKEGTNVKLTIVKAGTSNAVDVNIKRAHIIMKSVKGEMLDNNVGYIRIAAFQANTGDEFKKALSDLRSKNMKGLVLDLRNNGGGLLDQSIAVADEMVGEGLIVYTIDNQGRKEVAPADENKLGVPLAVLVNGGTASASEIVSGAVKDSKTGVLVGTRTFGKGLVQTIVPIPMDNSALKVTTARYYTPSGVCIQGKGIDPNYVIDIPESVRNKPEITRQDDVQLNKAIEVVRQQMGH
jgi:carboxyl-terminal processing protease